jgi:O-antigen/teichoic acid export membrane protein
MAPAPLSDLTTSTEASSPPPAGTGAADFRLGVTNAALRGGTLVGKLVLQLWMARALGAADMGVYALMAAAVAIGVFVVGLEYHYFTMRELATRAPARLAALLRDQLVVHGAAYVVFAFVLAALGLLGALPALPLHWFVLLLLLEHVSHEAYCSLNALSRPLAANVVLFMRTAAWAFPVIVLATVFPGQRRLDLVFLAWTVGAAASLFVAAGTFRGLGWRQAFREGPDWPEIRGGLRTAAPFIVITGSSMGQLFADRFIIQASHGTAAVGVYSFFAGLTTAITTLINAGVLTIRLPRLVRAHRAGPPGEFARELRAAWIWAAAGAFGLAALAGAAIHPVLRFVGRAEYSTAVGVFWLLLAAAVIRALADVPLCGLYAKGRDRALFVINILGMAVAVSANLLLVPRLGIAGAGLSAVGGALTMFLAAAAAIRAGERRVSNIDPAVGRR